MLDGLTKIDPAIGITTMRMMAGVQTAILAVVFWMSIILGGLALGLTVSGLFSVLSYLVEQRRTEIGVRMALGATAPDMVTLVLSQLMRPDRDWRLRRRGAGSGRGDDPSCDAGGGGDRHAGARV